jgi:hypothetical protein
MTLALSVRPPFAWAIFHASMDVEKQHQDNHWQLGGQTDQQAAIINVPDQKWNGSCTDLRGSEANPF